jgi:cytochrome c biogenesis protein CcmG/thiol:disulfide interchange protein DsbE
MRLRYAVPFALFIGLAAALFAGLWLKPKELPSALIDKPAPPFDLPAVAGLDVPGVSTQELQGQVTILNVFASWCVPCRAEHGELTKLMRDPDIKGRVHLFGVNYKDKADDARAFLAELGNPYERIGTDTGRLFINLGAYGVPETYLIDSHGRIRFRLPAPITPYDVDTTVKPVLRKLLAEAGS